MYTEMNDDKLKSLVETADTILQFLEDDSLSTGDVHFILSIAISKAICSYYRFLKSDSDMDDVELFAHISEIKNAIFSQIDTICHVMINKLNNPEKL